MADHGTWDFGLLVATIADGELRDEATEELRDTVEKLYDRARAGQKTVKGSLTIAVDIAVTKDGLVVLEPNVKSKLPRKTRRETPMYVGRSGLTVENPRQLKLGLREIGGTREVREPGDRANQE